MPDFATIYQQYFRFVWSSARRLGIGPDSIDDVVQEVFIVIHEKIHTLRQPDSLRSWIYGIVRRTASAHRRKFGGTREFVSLPVDESLPATTEATPLSRAENRSQLELLAKILSGIAEAKREVFVLVELEEMSVPEVSEALEIPLNTAYSRLRHARQEFETALERLERARTGRAS